ncbi:MAG: helix-turn-helix transcriptional regulator [Oscillospiraceae bacterium]
MSFASVLKKLRESKGINQKELAQQLGLSKSAISMYEGGYREPDFETLEVIADYFNVDMNYLHGLKARSNSGPLTNDELLLQDINKLPQEYKDKITDLIRLYVDAAESK